MKRLNVFVLLLVLGLVMALGRTPEAKAGLYNADGEVTYKEYWMPHKEFTAGCEIPLINDKPSGNSWFTEPDTMAKCPKTMTLNIPDDFSQALKVELYVDLWRNYDAKSARLRINGHPSKVYQPNVGYDWSRTPWIQEIPINELVQGPNTFLFWGESGKYHIHDIALRIYYDDTHPLVAGGINPDTTPPNGALVSIQSLDPGQPVIPAYDGGLLWANNNQIKLTANVAEVANVEFHAYYDGYDDDNDGQTRDWHSVNRNNWWPGGKPEQEDGKPGVAPATGGTINHIGTIKITSAMVGLDQSIVWDIPHVVNQSGVRFKIRIVDASGNVREAPGGATPGYTLVRNYPVVYYTMPNFDDFGLHMSGNRPDIVTYQFPLPADLNLADVSKAYLLGMYWRVPLFTLNGTAPASVRQQWTNVPAVQYWVTDPWSIGIKTLNKTSLLPGMNTINFLYSNGTGNFVEHPGPMIILHGNSTLTPDTVPPNILGRSPAPNSTDVDIFSPVTVRVGDSGVGVDKDSIIMSVNNVPVTPVMSGPSNNLSLTYTPSVPFPTETSIRVTVYACDLLGNCMTSADEYYFETEAPDITPPVISNVLVNTTNASATVTWLTNETASSMVEWGASTSYEKPSVSDPALVTSHTIQLTGLQSNTTYNYRLTSTDYFGNTVVTGNLTFQTKRDPGAILSDEFSGCMLDTSVWSYVNPLNDSPLKMTGAGAQISVPAGTGHDLWKQGLQAPRLMQFVTNQDFDVKVKFESTISKKTQTMGLLVQQDATNWLRFNFQNDGIGINSLVVVSSVNNNPVVVSTTPISIGTTANSMRVTRVGNFWNLQYSTDGSSWIYAATVERTLTMSAIGPFVGNTSTNPAHVGVIDYFENVASPLSGDDTLPTLTVSAVGLGTITRDPEKTNYQCNEEVQLTAVPAPEWEFGGWSGAINSANPTTSIIITQSANVVATFTNDTPYVMNVNVVSNGVGTGGTVTKNPEQPTYLYGDVVTLTATPTPGWTFTGWSGSFTGTDPVAGVPVTGDMNITATFDEDEYTLDTMILADGVGVGGAISVDPVQPIYKYGDVVTLTLTLDPGWTFVGWEGEGVSGTATTLPLTMTQNVVAVAHIAQNQYDLNIDYINNGDDEGLGNGVIRDPEQTTYGYGQVVTLTASPDLGWVFAGWGGALSGTELTRTLEITQDNVITATFNQIHYELNVTSNDGEKGTVTVSPQKDYYLYGDVVTLTPVPEPGYEFVMWTGDKTGSEDPLIFAMTQDVTLEAVFAVDMTPIEILSHEVQVLGTVAVIKWTTDVPGNSQVQYGLTTEYGGGTETQELLVLVHTITLTGLEPEKLYYYMIQSMDEFGNPVTLGDHFSTSTSSGLASDDFSSCQLSDRWTWDNGPLDDGQHSMTGTGVSISVPAGSRHNIWTDGIGAPRLMQASNNTDFTIEVKFDSPMVDGGTMQGVFIQQDDQTFIRFNFYKRADPAALVYHVYTFNNLTQKQVSDNAAQPDTPGPMYMRIIRLGDKWEQWISFDGENWTRNVKFDFPMVVKQVGIFAGNDKFKGNFPAHTAVIDYFVNTASAIPLDESFYKITSSVEGSGQIKFQPSKTGYYCGQEVAVLATGAPGWSFAGWSGDLSGSLASRTITVNNDMNIIARFQQGAAGFRLLLPLTVGNDPNKR
ncbi:MAG TPA: DUF1349 domain-containing protein [Promineifilum sp.]|nr:DUF1349 domain-containing protein [Promineifilum sp.]HRQ11710.1 DUF1349 domain-containing protein [Promineifilum sp.]